MAVPTLENLVLFVALPGFGDMCAIAVDAALEIAADEWTRAGRVHIRRELSLPARLSCCVCGC